MLSVQAAEALASTAIIGFTSGGVERQVGRRVEVGVVELHTPPQWVWEESTWKSDFGFQIFIKCLWFWYS